MLFWYYLVDQLLILLLSIVAKKKSKSSGTDSGEENMSKKDLALHQAIDQITSAFGKGAIMWLGRKQGHRDVPVISTGSFALDMALGTGGLPKVCMLMIEVELLFS